jgi:hypothetical protein
MLFLKRCSDEFDVRRAAVVAEQLALGRSPEEVERRAEMPAFGSDDLVALELFLAWRAQGLAMEAPGVRR